MNNSPNYAAATHYPVPRSSNFSSPRIHTSDSYPRTGLSALSMCFVPTNNNTMMGVEEDDCSLFMKLRLSPSIKSTWSPAVAGRFSFNVNPSDMMSPTHKKLFHNNNYHNNDTSVCVGIDEDSHTFLGSITTDSSVHSDALSEQQQQQQQPHHMRSRASSQVSHRTIPTTYANVVSCGYNHKEEGKGKVAYLR